MSQRRRGNGRQAAVEEEGAPIRPRSCVRKDGDRARTIEQAESDTIERRGLRAWRAWPPALAIAGEEERRASASRSWWGHPMKTTTEPG